MYIQTNTIDIRMSLIGKIVFKNDEDLDLEGTGFLVDKDIVITAYHNVKYYEELKKDWKITFIKGDIIETCSISEIIKSNEEIDIAIIRINNSIEQDSYFEMIDFPILNDFRTIVENIEVNILGYRAGVIEQDNFSAVINSMNQDGTVVVHYNRDMFGDSAGLSGSPLIIKGGLYVYGLNLIQYDPEVGLHIKSIINNLDCVKFFFDGTPVKVKKFDSYKLIDKEEYKICLLNEVRRCINEIYVTDPMVLRRIIRESEGVIDILNNMDVSNFEKFINLINAPDKRIERNKFKLDSNYQRYIEGITNIVCHISVLSCKYPSKELNLETLKPIKIRHDKYLSYVYSFKGGSYEARIIQLFNYLEENPEYDLNGISHILLGNEICDLDCSRCTSPFNGPEMDFNSIVSNICRANGYEEDEKDILNITNIESNFQQLNFHCKRCLNFDTQRDIKSIKNNITNTLGE